MAFTRLRTIGMEHNDSAEYNILSKGGLAPTISTTKAQGGTRSLRFAINGDPAGRPFASSTQIRAGVWVNHVGNAGANAGRYSAIFTWTTGAGSNNYVAWEHDTGNLVLVVNGTSRDSVAATSVGFDSTDQWFHCGLTLYTNASSGWVSFYLDGTKILEWSGDTAAAVTAVYFGGFASTITSFQGWANYAYFDDFYVDSASGEADAAPPIKQFDWSIANGNGTNSAWTGSDGNSTDNYLLVDDTTPDDDTTYVAATTTGLKDTYNTSSITVPSGYVLSAVIPSVLAKKSGGSEQIKLLAYDGANTTTSAAQDLAADYDVAQVRMSAQPDGTDWNETDFNAMEFGFESAI